MCLIFCLNENDLYLCRKIKVMEIYFNMWTTSFMMLMMFISGFCFGVHSEKKKKK